MNNFTTNTSYGLVNTRVPYHHDDDDVSHTIRVSVISLRPGYTIGVDGSMDLFGSGAYMPPFFSPRVQSQAATLDRAHSSIIPRNAQLRPRLTTHSDPLLMENQQNMGLEKLRREIYNPGIQRRSLYYRDYDSLTKSKGNEDAKSCVVCLDDFDPREMVTLTPCNHMFHDNCIVPWVKSHGQCPVCRFVISEQNEGRQTINNINELDNDPFARDLVSFIRDMEARG